MMVSLPQVKLRHLLDVAVECVIENVCVAGAAARFPRRMQSDSPPGAGDRRSVLDAARRRHSYETPLEAAVASMIDIGEWVGLTAVRRRPAAWSSASNSATERSLPCRIASM